MCRCAVHVLRFFINKLLKIMNNKTKLLLANLFALFAVVVILVGYKMMGVDPASGSEALVFKLVLVLVPQMGFFYMLFLSPKLESKAVED
jgi:hypothetical protein